MVSNVKFWVSLPVIGLIISGCGGLGPLGQSDDENATISGDVVEIVSNDVEAPEIFATTEDALWDGKPSLGGVWVSHPGVLEPTRAVMRNPANNKFVIGTIFYRPDDGSTPRMRASADAAEALELGLGTATSLQVTALRSETVSGEAEATTEFVDDAGLGEASSADLDAQAEDIVSGTPAEPAEPAAPVTPQISPPAPTSQPEPAASSLDKPFIQLGIFSQEANAERAKTLMQDAGAPAKILQETISGKPFWRVIVGPASSETQRNSILSIARSKGFTDAYPVRS